MQALAETARAILSTKNLKPQSIAATALGCKCVRTFESVPRLGFANLMAWKLETSMHGSWNASRTALGRMSNRGLMDRSLETEASAQRPARISEALRISGVVQHRRYRPAKDNRLLEHIQKKKNFHHIVE